MHMQSVKAMDSKLNYRPDIDGLRAIAVLAVIANHTDTRLAPSGFLGVDIFFAISGFVITSSLIKRERTNLKSMLLPFYGRRIKRLVPALLSCILISSLIFSLVSATPATNLWSGIWAAFGLSNIHFYQEQTDYFSPVSELSLFLHTWSLGVEEQFYLIYPFIFWFALQRKRLTQLLLSTLAIGLICAMAVSKISARSALAFLPEQLRSMGLGPYLILLLTVGGLFISFARLRAHPWTKSYGYLALSISILSTFSFFGFIILTHAQSKAAYFLTTYRFWELGAGCLLALSVNLLAATATPASTRSSLLGRHWLSLASMTAMISCFFLPVSWKIVTTPLMIGLTVLVLGITTDDRPSSTIVDGLLRNHTMVYLGLISYSLYLWHWPLLVLTRWTIGIHWWSVIILLPLTLFASFASYKWIESPLRRARWASSDQTTIAFGFTAQLITAGSLVTVLSQANNSLYTGNKANRAADLASLSASNTSLNVRTCGSEVLAALQKCIVPPQKKDKASIILLGDSHAGHLYPAMGAILERTGIGIKTYNTAGNSHQPFPTVDFGKGNAYLDRLPAKAAQINAFYAAIKPSIKKGDIMVIAIDWSRYFNLADPEHDSNFRRWRLKLNDLATELSHRHAAVVIFTPLPHFHSGGGPNCERQWFRPWTPESCSASIPYSEASAKSKALIEALHLFASRHRNAKVYDPTPLFCNEQQNKCMNGNSKSTYFIDANHLSAQSEIIVANGITAFLKEQKLLNVHH